jgi:hypothetical protein
MPRVKLSKTTKALLIVMQFYIVALFVLIIVRFLRLL